MLCAVVVKADLSHNLALLTTIKTVVLVNVSFTIAVSGLEPQQYKCVSKQPVFPLSSRKIVTPCKRRNNMFMGKVAVWSHFIFLGFIYK